MGISADSSARAFPSADIDSFMKRIYNDIPVDPFCHMIERNTSHIMIAADPSGGGSSQFAVISLCQLPSGTIMVHSCPVFHPPTSLIVGWTGSQIARGFGSSLLRSAVV
eukprot:2285098-Prymnesium_polylepis.1